MRLNAKIVAASAAAPLLLIAGSAFAQTYTTSGATTGTGSTGTGTSGMTSASGTSAVNGTSTANPNVPNTGAGGDLAANLGLLGVSGVAAVAGGLYLARKRFA